MTISYSKKFSFEGRDFIIGHFDTIAFANDFHRELYTDLFKNLADGKCAPHIDCDNLTLKACGTDYYQFAIDKGLRLNAPSKKNPNKDREKLQIAIQKFCEEFPLFVSFLQNCRFKAAIAIKHAECLIDEPCSISNFIKLKRITGDFNRLNWTRQMDGSESQASVSNLGTISESLLNKALGNLTSSNSFFKVTSDRVNSYGDFVLMCLPNNLWLSVKSNFARERLLASGYSNDILAVGFFEDFKEFTSSVRIRNMQRAGFLCIYMPDVPVTKAQEKLGISTYDQTIKFYEKEARDLPLNINGTPFFRPLSSIADDLNSLLGEINVERRLSVDF